MHVRYGRVGAHAGEYATSRFALGLFPIASYWVKDGVETEIRMHPRSVVAAYARWWAPVAVAVVLAKVPWRVAIPVSVALALASALAWSWRRMPKSRRRESDFNLAAFGLRCDPAYLTVLQLARVRALLEHAWEQRGGVRLPHEVVERGATDTEEAVIAYGLLRLAGERADARRIVSTYRKQIAREGLYRDAAAPPRVMIDRVALARVAREVKKAKATPPPQRVVLHIIGLSAVSVAGVCLAASFLWSPHAGADDLTPARVGSTVEIDCMAIAPLGNGYAECRLSDGHRVVIETTDDDPGTIVGVVKLHTGPHVGSPDIHVYLDATSARFQAIAYTAFVVVGLLAMWGWWIRSRVCRGRSGRRARAR